MTDPRTVLDGRLLANWQQLGAGAAMAGGDPPAAFGFDPGIAPALPDGSYVVAPQALFGSAADDAVWINNALVQAKQNTGGAAGGLVRLMPYRYNIQTTVQIPAGASLVGIPSATNKTSPSKGTVLRLANGANTHMVQFAGANGYLADVELDGNKAGQSSGFGNGVLAAAGADWSMIERCFIHDAFFRGIDVTGCQAVKVLDCSVQACNDAGVFLDSNSSDQHIRGCLIGSNGAAGIFTSAFIVHITECDIFSNTTHGIDVDGSGGSWGTMIANCGVDRNGQIGVLVTSQGVAVTGCSLHSNGQAATNTYSSITVDNTSFATTGCSIGGNSFWLDAGITNLVAWHIQYKNTAAAKTHGNQFQAGSAGTGTISAASQAKDANETA